MKPRGFSSLILVLIIVLLLVGGYYLWEKHSSPVAPSTLIMASSTSMIATSTYDAFLPGKILISDCDAGSEVGVFAANHTINMQYSAEGSIPSTQQTNESLEQWQVAGDRLTLSKETTVTLLPRVVDGTTVLVDKEGIGSGGCGYIIADSFMTMDDYAKKYDTDPTLRSMDLQTIQLQRGLFQERNL